MFNDLRIFNKVKEGDIEAFEVLFRRYYEPLCRYACRLVEDTNVAEEVVQELFYKIWKERKELQIFLSVKSYLYSAIRNQALLHLEHLQVTGRYQEKIKSRPEESMPATPAEQLEYNELQQYIEGALERLPERRRKIFCMNRYEGKKYTEIAGELSLSVKTVEAEISKALRELKKGIGNYVDNKLI